MDITARTALTSALTTHVASIAAVLRRQILDEAGPRAAAEQLHADENVGEDFEVWTDLLSRRAAVLWVLKSVYVRVLEDRGLLSPKRIVGGSSSQLFASLAPDLGDTAYLRWVYRDLAHVPGGLPELFAPQPAEVATPTDAQSRALLDFWRERNPDTGELRFTFTDEAFDGRLMGDLYQDLDPVVKARFALVQTPDFVLDFMLDETLTPAIAEFGVHEVRVLDPACGSGHFLLAAFKRLVAALREAEPSWAPEQLVAHVLPRVVGIDLNDYACGLARARLVMTALDVLGSKDLAAASGLHPQVFWADGLEQLERDDLGQISFGFATEDEKPQATLSQPEVRAKLRPVLKAGFHVVVANPPYITEKDAQRRAYHRETVGKTRRYLSASRTYSLGNPFTERMFQLCVDGGYVGDFNANSFMKREFGRSLIEEVLAKYKLTKVIDTSGAYFPSYGTPTVLLFGRRKAFDGSPVVVVGGKRGEPGKPANAALGHVWRSIVQHHATPHFENDFVSVRGVEAETMRTHPWNVGGGGAVALQSALEEGGETKLSMHSEAIGRTTVLGEDGAWILPRAAASRCSLTPDTLPFVVGENCRDWSLDVTAMEFVVYPYELVGRLPTLSATAAAHLWPRRRLLQGRSVFGKRIGEKTGHWWLHLEHYTDKLRAPLSLTFAFKATHNHFALDRGGKVFNRTAPVIKLPAGATEEQHLALLGQLNSSAACCVHSPERLCPADVISRKLPPFHKGAAQDEQDIGRGSILARGHGPGALDRGGRAASPGIVGGQR